jgi:hypothetical protein
MREAGFEVERDQELTRRRERRRATLAWVGSLAMIALGAATTAILTEHMKPHRHYVLAVVLGVSLTLALAAVRWVVATWRALEKADQERAAREARR